MVALTKFISYPLYWAAAIWRRKQLRSFLLGVLIFYILDTYFTWGYVEIILVLIARYGIVIPLMLGQFGLLFWFLSRTKVIETIPGDKGGITFADYYGQDNLVALVKQWVSLLSNPKKLKEIGGTAISGILLTGPPGTGKTYLARALSGDSDAAFIGMAGSDFTAMFMGVGVLKVRGMFNKARRFAREYGACILFIDEIDAIASGRGSVDGDSPVQSGGVFGGMGGLGVMSRLLVELDGVTEIPHRERIQNKLLAWFGYPPVDPGVVLVMAATNRPQVLDSAIVRPGRFDRKISVPLPDRTSRRALIKGFLSPPLKHKKMDIDYLVDITAGSTPALLENAITSEAPRLALAASRKAISMDDIEEALQIEKIGLPQPIGEWDEEQRKQVAIHEAGHVVAMYHLRPHQTIARASIQRRGSALGYVAPVNKTDIYAQPLSRFYDDIKVALAGHIATEQVLGELWTGSAGDFNTIRGRLMALYSLGDLGEFPALPLRYDKPDFSKEVHKHVEKEMKRLTKETKALLVEHRAELDAIIDALLEHDDLNGQEIEEIIKGVGK